VGMKDGEGEGGEGMDEDTMEERFKEILRERVASDVFD
jgi:hypothetical protein